MLQQFSYCYHIEQKWPGRRQGGKFWFSMVFSYRPFADYYLHLFEMSKIKIKRVYEPAEPSDGFRVLVDRLWPRGIKKENARVDIWLKEIAPTTELRKWFNHEPGKWTEFRKLYTKELKKSAAVTELKQYLKENKQVTFLYSARDEEHNQAVALKEFAEKLIAGK